MERKMRKFINTLLVMVLVVFGQLAIEAQTSGSIAGTVVDQTGSVVPNATVTVKGESGQEYTVTTADNGTYRIPAVSSGLYTVTVTTTAGFKTFVTSNVKVDVGLPTTVDAALEVGAKEQVVEVTTGGEVLQTETAAVTRNITGREIIEKPIASRDALDLVLLTPGANTVGRPRASSINGLPKGAISITIDGVDVQDNNQRSAEGFFTYVRPRVDAIEEVTISTSNPGAESGGDGAVQIRFVTKRGTNNYRGSAFYQHRNEALSANYFYVNRDAGLGFDENGKALRQKTRLHQYGASFGGPIPFPHFGEGGPFFHSGKDTAFFFANYEEFRFPQSVSRTYSVLTPEAQAGNFSYVTATGVQTRNIYTIAAAANQLATPDPTVAAVLARIRSAVGTTGRLNPVSGVPNLQNYSFAPSGADFRKFLALRFDVNLNKSNSVEFVTNRQKFAPGKDFLNTQDERFPGFPFYGQGSQRNSYSAALRSTITNNLINEARFAMATGSSEFSPGISPADFSYSGGYLINITGTGASSPYSRNSYSSRNTPTYDFTDSMTLLVGSHNINFGGQYKLIRSEDINQRIIVPTIGFGAEASDLGLQNLFNSTTLPGSTTAQQTSARAFYATLVGRVNSFASTAYLTADGTYQVNAIQEQLAEQKTYGLFAQDSWKIRPNLTVNYGLRWQPQGPYVILSDNYAALSSYEDVYGLSGVGNLFKPGTLTGRVPTVVGLKKGDKAYKGDNNNFGPSVGVVYSPDFQGEGILRSIFGSSGRSVFRGGYSASFVREGTALLASILAANPGGNLPVSRNFGLNNLTVGTNLRDANNPNLTPAPFPATASYPITLTTATSANAFDPNLKTGTVHSFSFGYQREIDKNTVVEVRYVGNRGVDLFRQHNLNGEVNVIENGVAAEFAIAQQNLAANVAANRCQTGVTAANCQYNFAYFGPGTGTSPVPISLAYITGVGAAGASNAANYQTAAAALFRNIAFASNLSRVAPSVLTFGANLEGANARRTNAINAGLPANFFFVNPTTATAGAYIVDNSLKSWYDSGVIEVRRRLSAGLRFQASYVFAKAQSDAYASNLDNFSGGTERENGRQLAKNVAPFDIRHAFKFDATFDLPFGNGTPFFSNANGFVNAIIGGFTILPTIRWQSGSPFSLGNVTLVGMTREDLQKEIRVRKDTVLEGVNVVTYLPDDIILNTRRAFAIDPTTTSGFGAQLGAPTGRFIAPATLGGCLQRYSGECGFNNLILYGPSFFKFDVTLAKKIKFGENRNIELRATLLDALNHPNFRIGGFGADVVNLTVGGATFGQLGSTSAYQDLSTTNDSGGRQIDLMLRINF